MGQTLIAVMTVGFGSTIGNVFGGYLQDIFGRSNMLRFSMIITFIGVVIVEIVIFLSRNRKNLF